MEKEKILKRFEKLLISNPNENPRWYLVELLEYEKEKDNRYSDCVDILEYYTKITGKRLAKIKGERGYKTNHEYIKKVFKYSIRPTVQEVKYIIKMKHLEWKDDVIMKKYIRLPTLFAKKNFIGYFMDLQDLKSNPKSFKSFKDINNLNENVYSQKSKL